MKRKFPWHLAGLVILLLALITSVAVASSPSSSSFVLQRSTLPGAQAPGGVMSSASYQLHGAFGGMIGVIPATSSASGLCIGYICQGYSVVYLPMVRR
ncbi:MAG: hypothetical protein ACOYXO_19110 [Chloroflexota bacterium]|uniref:Uncharacterized protein n=1 Tax=Bellilinea caldifistulae TaxID=360411 RepID=A0A7C4Q2G7_9CHLR